MITLENFEVLKKGFEMVIRNQIIHAANILPNNFDEAKDMIYSDEYKNLMNAMGDYVVFVGEKLDTFYKNDSKEEEKTE